MLYLGKPRVGGGSIDPAKLEVLKAKSPGYEKNRNTTSVLGWDESAKAFTIEPYNESYTVFSGGVKYVKTTKESYAIDTNVSGLIYVYFNEVGVLEVGDTFQPYMIIDCALTAILYWNANSQSLVMFQDERHGFDRDVSWHIYAHETVGTLWGGGLGLTDITPNGDGNLDSDAQFGVSDGVIHDEDLIHNLISGLPQDIANPISIPVMYRDSSGAWETSGAGGFAVKNIPNGRVAWNKNTGGVWSQEEAENNSFVCSHIVATPDVFFPIIAVQGQANYSTITDALRGAIGELSNISMEDMPTAEFKAIGTVIYRTNDIFTNAVKSNITPLQDGNSYIDWRTESLNNTTTSEVKQSYISQEIQGLLDSMSIDTASMGKPYVEGDVIKIEISHETRSNIRFWSNGIQKSFDVPAIVELSHGTSSNPLFQVIYATWIETDQKVKLTASSVMPMGSFLPIGYVSVQSNLEVPTNGAIAFQRTRDAITFDGQGTLSRSNEKTRFNAQASMYHSGQDLEYVSNDDGSTISLNLSSGFFYQMNKQSFPIYNTATDGFYVIGSENTTISNFDKKTNIADLNLLRDGTEIGVGKYVAIDVYAIGNGSYSDGTSACSLAISLAKRQYDNKDDCVIYAEDHEMNGVNRSIFTVQYPICSIALKYLGGGKFDNAFTTLIETIEWGWHSVGVAYRSWKSNNYPNYYANNSNDLYSKQALTGATKVKVRFSAFDTENNYDKVAFNNSTSVSSSNYQLLFQGNLGSFWTGEMTASTLYSRFTSDGSVQRTGFNINEMTCYAPKTIISGQQSTKILDRR